MKIAVIGAGNIGGTLGTKWAAVGHEVVYGVRDVASQKVKSMLDKASGRVRADTVENALRMGDVILLAIPWGAVPSTVAAHAALLAGKIVIDSTNNFGGPIINNVETILTEAPTAQVFRAFNSLGWEVFARPQFGSEAIDLFYCGAPGESQSVVAGLISDAGLRPVWVGDLERAALVDNIGALWVTLAIRQGLGRRLGFKMLQD